MVRIPQSQKTTLRSTGDVHVTRPCFGWIHQVYPSLTHAISCQPKGVFKHLKAKTGVAIPSQKPSSMSKKKSSFCFKNHSSDTYRSNTTLSGPQHTSIPYCTIVSGRLLIFRWEDSSVWPSLNPFPVLTPKKRITTHYIWESVPQHFSWRYLIEYPPYLWRIELLAIVGSAHEFFQGVVQSSSYPLVN